MKQCKIIALFASHEAYIELCRQTYEEIRAAARRDAFNLKQGMKAFSWHPQVFTRIQASSL